MQKVLFDSSFLMSVAESPTSWKEDIESNIGKFEPLLLQSVEKELGRIALRGGKKGRLARVSLEAAAGFARVPDGGGDVDDELVSAALSTGALVATVDQGLIETLRASNVRLVRLTRGRVLKQ